MTSAMVKVCSKPSFLRKQVYKLSVNGAIRQCESMKEHLRKSKRLSKEDKYAYVAFLDMDNSKHKGLFFTTGYHHDGSIKPMEAFSIEKGKIASYDIEKNLPIAALDMYESSVYLHSYDADGKYINGYLIKETVDEGVLQVVFTEEKVKILKKNVNNSDEVNTIKEFLSRYVL